jgi:hypothetical protein
MPRRITSGRVGGQVLGNLATLANAFESVEANTNIVFTPDGTGVTEFTKDLYTSSNAGFRFGDSDTNYAAIKAPSALSANYTLTLPADDGDANQVLKTDGNGNLSWTAAGLAVTNRTTADSNNYFIAMSDQSTGSENTLSVADGTRFYYTPNASSATGRLTVGNTTLSASTASSSTSTGALIVAGGAGIGGQMTAVSIVETSSIALKENVNPIQDALDKILQLKGVTYDRLDSKEHESGLIAEWTEKVLPELVTRDTNGDVVGIKYTKLTAYLIEAIKTLNNEIETLKRKT